MKKNFDAPELTIILFTEEDIITVSVGGNGGTGDQSELVDPNDF